MPVEAAPPPAAPAAPGATGYSNPFTGSREPPPAYVPPAYVQPAYAPPAYVPPGQVAPYPLESPRQTAADAREQKPRERDAHVDRVLILPTAETHPAGSFYISSYEIVIGQLGYALSDSTQISLTATPPLNDGTEHIIPADISIKSVVVRQPGVSVAVIGSASGILGVPEFSGFLGRAGGAVTLCGSFPQCGVSVSVASTVALAGPASIWFSGAGVTWRLGRLISLLGEIDTAVPLGEVVGQANGVLGGFGMRLSGARWGVDLALLGAGKAHEKAGALPWLVASYRMLP